jgi:hypothetical protein
MFMSHSLLVRDAAVRSLAATVRKAWPSFDNCSGLRLVLARVDVGQRLPVGVAHHIPARYGFIRTHQGHAGGDRARRWPFLIAHGPGN